MTKVEPCFVMEKIPQPFFSFRVCMDESFQKHGNKATARKERPL